MSYTEKEIKNQIVEKYEEKFGKKTDRGYLRKPEENLVKIFSNWAEIKKELEDGNGKELEEKFLAIHSSSALCVNNLAPFKVLKEYENSIFHDAVFEQKLPTKLRGTPPHLDFYLENADTIIGFESKFTEYFEKKIDHTKKNLGKYFMRKELDYLPNSFEFLISHYKNCTSKMHLDVAQLIKHSIGLINNKKNKKATLVYIFWEPMNWEKIEICKQHRKEICDFATRIEQYKDIITFESLSYIDFWGKYENNKLLKEYIQLVKDRYCFEIVK